MKRIFCVLLFTCLFVLNSCVSTNTAGLETLDKPTWLGQFFARVNPNDPSVKRTYEPIFGGYKVTRDYGPIYRYVLFNLFNDLERISDEIKSQTGYPLDIDRFLKELEKGEVIIEETGITWSAISPTKFNQNTEAFVQINVPSKKIWIVKGGKSKNERIRMQFTY